jgi:photosystem II stability/assembly factor-like uncharacterized protein
MPSLPIILKQVCGHFSFVLLLIAHAAYAQKHVDIIKNAEHITLKEVIEQTEAYYRNHDKGKGSGYKAFKRWEYFHRMMMADDQDVKAFDLRNYNEVKAQRERNNSNARVGGPITAGSWQQVGPAYTVHENHSGRINAVVVDPVNINNIYAGSPAGGLWHSRDGGKTWKCITDNILSFLGITSVVIDPGSPVNNRTLYIVTGDKDNSDTNYVGFFRSGDNGNTWTQVPYQWSTISGFAKLMMHPTDNTILYALANHVGVMRYKIGSSSTQWTQILAGNFTDMEFNPTNPSMMYVTGESGTFYSTTSGNSWVKSPSAIPTSARNEMAVTPANPKIVYLYVGQREVASLYKSTDAGVTYSKVPSTMNIQNVALYQWYYDLTIAVSPTDANAVWLGGVDIYRSTDGGVNWAYDNMGHVDYHSLNFFHGYLYAGNDGGVTRRTPGAPPGHFEDLSQGLPVGQIYKLGIDPTSTDHVLAGFQDNGTASIVNGVAFTFNAGDGMECFVDPLNPNTLFSSTQFGDFYRSRRGSGEHVLINPPLGPRMWLTPFRMDPLNSKVIYVGYGELWKNTMQGDGTWINITNGALGTTTPIINFEIAPSNTNYIYVCKDDQIHVTKNGGSTWSLLTHQNTQYVTSLAVHSENPSTLWITSPNVSAWNRIPRVLKSTDAGATWTDVSGSLPFIDMLCIVYQKGSSNGIYVGTSQGIFYKDDTLPDWIRFDYNLPFSPITELEINYKDQKVYASTYGRGLWASPVYKASHPVACEGTGSITREVWNNIAGTDVSAIPVNSPPNATNTLTIFEAPSNQGSNFGARVRGYICPPATGSYTFWIASDDKSELWLSGDDNPANKIKIASVTGYTTARQWAKYPTQQSSPVTLLQGMKYYIEVLHKEASGADHFAVGWQMPDGTLERPITGNRLIPFVENIEHPPTVTFVSPQDGDHFHDTSVQIEADANDIDGDLLKVELFEGSSRKGQDFTAPFSFSLFTWEEGTHQLRLVATDQKGLTGTDSITITTTNPSLCQGSGTIARQVWNDITGTAVGDIPLDTEPTFSDELPIFETPYNVGSNYGQRLRGMLCAPQSGYYTFWIASDDKSELYLNHEDPFTPDLIASVSGYTGRQQWDKYAIQKSQPIYLEKGSAYLIQALHKEGSGTDHLAVGWQLPDGTLERPIPGSRLSPFEDIPYNLQPEVWINTPEDGQQFYSPSTVDIAIDINAYDEDGEVVQVDLYINGNHIATFYDDAFEYRWENVSAGTYRISAYAYDDYGDSDVAEVEIEVKGGVCVAAGTISHERWHNVAGTSVGTIPLNTPPGYFGELSKFEIPMNVGSNYASRVRGYLCVPADGDYVFYISSDDNSELWLSSDANPENAGRIAYVPGHTPVHDWIKYPSQTSASIGLKAGQQYYIEALHKEATGVDHLAVGWRLPDGTLERPIPGTRLSPASTLASGARLHQANIAMEDHESARMHVFPNPNNGLELNVEIAKGVVIENATTTKFQIFTTAGSVIDVQEIACIDGCNNFNVAFPNPLPGGIYFVEAVIGHKRYRSKLIVE